MSWGRRLLDEDAFNEQQETLAKAENPWGPLLGLPDAPADTLDVDPAKVAAALASVEGEGDDTGEGDAGGIGAPEPGQVTVETLRQHLAETPTSWDVYLALELKRAAPRKTALEALLAVMEDQGVDADTLTQVHEMLEAL